MNLSLNPTELKALIAEAVAETLQQLEADGALLGNQIAIPEAEAARLLSQEPHQLRDERLAGRITASVGRGGRILYSRQDLLAYLKNRRWKAKR